MCWSPTADLVAGCAIAAVGALSLASVRRPRDLALAALPALLGVHQLVESVVWREADGGGAHGTSGTAVMLWAVIAFPLLPAFVPLAVLCAASQWSRLRLMPFAAIGLASSAALAYVLAAGPVTAEPVGHTMRYSFGAIPVGLLVVTGYLVATIGSLLASDQREIRLLGLVAAAGALVCYALWKAEFVSTWCALAAVASVLILHWLRRPRKRKPAPDPFRRARIPAP